ncbi:hypothetical protein GCM10029992_52890 [Glycomyces albus]
MAGNHPAAPAMRELGPRVPEDMTTVVRDSVAPRNAVRAQAAARVKVTWVTPLGDEVASTR